MTPKEKAQLIIEQFRPLVKNDDDDGFTSRNLETQNSKKCAMLLIEEVLYFQNVVLEIFPSDGYQPEYWEEVKQEIINY